MAVGQTFLLLNLLILIQLASSRDSIFTFRLDSGKQTCIKEDVEAGGELQMEFQVNITAVLINSLTKVLAGNPLEVDYYLIDPRNHEVERKSSVSDSMFLDGTTLGGTYQVPSHSSN